ncbi:MAG TPA: hypothetical protein PLK30_25580 [Blastocatellia bacterium]|nr:hypothetical protein [Blastocatellia bacterium]
MFTTKNSHRNSYTTKTLLGGLLLIGAIVLYGASVLAQPTTIPLGTYSANITEAPSNPRFTVGEYRLIFLEGGKFQYMWNDRLPSQGTYVVSQDRVEFTLPFGVDACATKGVYQWSLQGNKLSLSLPAGQTDNCLKRSGMAMTYFKTDQLDSMWKNIGPVGGTIYSLFLHEGKIFAGTSEGGILVSADNGQSWKQANCPKGFAIWAFAAFNGYLFAGANGSVIFTSQDGGENWALGEPNLVTSPTFVVRSFTIFNGKLYAPAGAQGVIRITDNPFLWEQAGATGLTNQTVNSVVATSTNLFAGTDNGGVFVSTDGNNWSAVNNGLTLQRIWTMAVDGNTVYAGTVYGSGATPNEVFVTTNNGQNWTRVGNGLAQSFPAGYSNLIFKLLPMGGKLFAASTTGIIVNEGANWRVAYQGSPIISFYSLAGSGNQLYGGAWYDGVSRSVDGGITWSQVTNDFKGRSTGAVLKDNGVLYVAVADGAYLSTNEGQTWTRAILPYVAGRNFLAFEGKVFLGTSNGIYVTTNQGQSWVASNTGLTAGSVMRIVSTGNVLYAAVFNGGVFRSTNSGQNWTAVNNGLTSLKIEDLVTTSGNLFAGTDDGGVFRSINEGQSWEMVNVGLPSGPILAMTSSGNNLLAAVYGQAIYRSTDQGNNWTKSARGFPHPYVYSMYANGANVYAAGSYGIGVMRSTDNGQSWTLVNTGLDARYSNGFFVNGPTLYIATTNGICISNSLVNQQATVSAANYSAGAITEKAIVAAFGTDMAMNTEIAGSVPLPTTLAGTTIKVRDSNGVDRLAPMFFVSPFQINYQIPAGTAPGSATVTIRNSAGIEAIGSLEVKATAPSIFTANASGTGSAAAVDAITGAAAPFNATLANGQPNIISVFGTGLGGDATDVDGNFNTIVTARLDGNAVTLQYAGRSPGYVGLNQFNVVLPAGITSGSHTLTFTRGNVTSNTTTLTIR